MKASLAVLAVLAMLACSDATGDEGSTGSLSGTVTDPGGAAVSGARIVVSSSDETIATQSPSGVFTDDDGDYRIELFSIGFSQRKTIGQVTVTPPEDASLAEKVVAGIVLETGPDDPDTVVDIILDEQ